MIPRHVLPLTLDGALSGTSDAPRSLLHAVTVCRARGRNSRSTRVTDALAAAVLAPTSSVLPDDRSEATDEDVRTAIEAVESRPTSDASRRLHPTTDQRHST